MKNRSEYGFKLASLLGKDTTDPVEAVEFLRTVPAQNIVKAQESILSSEATNFPFIYIIIIIKYWTLKQIEFYVFL